MPAQYTPRVIVKFKDSLINPMVNDAAGLFLAQLITGHVIGTNWPQLEAEFQGITIEKLAAMSQTKLLNLMNLAFHRDPSYRFVAPNFLSYFKIPCPLTLTGGPEAVAHKISSWEGVETAYIAEAPAEDPEITPSRNPAWNRADTGYMRAAPGGIDAEFAWAQPGGDGGKLDGVNLNFFDIESNWDLTHPDLVPANPQFSGIGYRPLDRKYHGTGVLGIVIASDIDPADPNYKNSSLGITPNVAVTEVASYWVDNNNTDHYNTILSALNRLNFGDVLLLEIQVRLENPPGTVILDKLPVEYFQHNSQVIQLGTALGIVIVEAAGNGSHPLSALGIPWLQRPSDQDSGAIMVSAATPWTPLIDPPDYLHAPMVDDENVRKHNFGSRIDCYAWGDNIYATSCLPHPSSAPSAAYYQNFGDTSGASAIIAGAALSIQGMAEKQLGYRLSPLQIRRILSDPQGNTLSANSDPTNWNKDEIGVMPNLRSIINNVLNLTPDIYARDFVGDVGDPHSGPVSNSPDIILRSAPVANYQAEFGELNVANRDNVMLSNDAVRNQPNYVYVRVRNRGRSDAANVKATVYWSEVATLVKPDPNKVVGSVVIPSVPVGNILTVSPPITWAGNQIPPNGHYCFVCLVNDPRDPAPLLPADFLNWDNFLRFVRDYNNVTWRNFNVVEYQPTGSADMPLDFEIAGAWDEARAMRLEVVSRLPAEAAIILQVEVGGDDRKVLTALRELGPVKMDDKKQGLAIRLNPHGRSGTRGILFRKDFRARSRLLISVPKQFRRNPYEIYVRQLYQEREVGRITWRLTPKTKGRK